MPLPSMQPNLPPSASPAAPNLGPGTAQQGNQGNSAAAMIEVTNAVKMLEKALPMIPMGSPIHEKILNFAKDIAKNLSQGDGNQALEINSLVQMARNAAQQAPLNQLAKAFPQQAQGQPPAMGGGAPQPQAA
jgi:hypothetical protein